jgi:L-cysteine desulfidase
MKKQSLLNLLNSLVTPAFGCTEIGCIAYASSTAAEYLSNDLKEMLVYVSPFIYRNVANVGVPELGKVGVDGIAAAGYVVKKPEKKLMVLNGITKSQIQQTHKLLKNELVKFFILKKCDPVYTKVIAKDIKGNICEVLIEQKHDTIQHIKLNDCKIFVEKPAVIKDADETINVKDVSLTDIYNGIQMLNRKDLHFFIRGINMNEDIAKVGDQKHYFKLKNKKTN